MAKKIAQRKLKKIMEGEQSIYYVGLPGIMMKELGWKEKQKLVVSKSGRRIIIEEPTEKLSASEAKKRMKRNRR